MSLLFNYLIFRFSFEFFHHTLIKDYAIWKKDTSSGYLCVHVLYFEVNVGIRIKNKHRNDMPLITQTKLVL